MQLRRHHRRVVVTATREQSNAVVVERELRRSASPNSEFWISPLIFIVLPLGAAVRAAEAISIPHDVKCVPVKWRGGFGCSPAWRGAMNSYVMLMNSSANGHAAHTIAPQRMKQRSPPERTTMSKSNECQRHERCVARGCSDGIAGGSMIRVLILKYDHKHATHRIRG